MRIAISSEARLLHIVRCVVRWQAQEAGLRPSEVDCLALAIDEAAANVIRHAYDNRPDARLALEVRTFPDRLEFILEDWGRKVNDEALRPPSRDELRPGGLGTLFMNTYLDNCSFDVNCKEGNRLRMVKYLSRTVGSGDESPSPKRG